MQDVTDAVEGVRTQEIVWINEQYGDASAIQADQAPNNSVLDRTHALITEAILHHMPDEPISTAVIPRGGINKHRYRRINRDISMFMDADIR